MSISAPRRSFLWRFLSAEHQVEFFAAFYGPTNRALAAVGDRAAALRADMLEAARRFDVSEEGHTLVLRMDYLEAVVHKPAPWPGFRRSQDRPGEPHQRAGDLGGVRPPPGADW